MLSRMAAYARRLGAAIALSCALAPAASAAPLVTVGVNIPVPAPVVYVRPAQPAVGWVWVDGYWGVNAWGHRQWVNGYWAAPPRRVVMAPRIAPVAVIPGRPVVVRSAPARRVVVRRR